MSNSHGRQQGAATLDARSVVELEPFLSEWLAARRSLFIGGEPVDSGAMLEVENPTSGQPLAEVAHLVATALR